MCNLERFGLGFRGPFVECSIQLSCLSKTSKTKEFIFKFQLYLSVCVYIFIIYFNNILFNQCLTLRFLFFKFFFIEKKKENKKKKEVLF